MGLFEGKTPAERNKTIIALVLPLVALVLLLRMFFGGDSRPARTTNTNNSNRRATAANGRQTAATAEGEDPSLAMPNPLPAVVGVSYNAPEAARNIFAFPPVVVRPVVTPVPTEAPTPTPTPPPPLAVNSVSPANVYARAPDVTLEVSGDKFTPQTRVFLEGQELQTTFKSAQQLSAQVPRALIGAQGARTVTARTPDGSLYSNTATLNVMAAPTPQFTFVGFWGDQRYARVRAVLKAITSNPSDSSPNNLVTVSRGEMLPGGRFKVVAISEKEIKFEDVQLKIEHTVPFTETRGANTPSGPTGRTLPRPPQPAGDDDEP